AAIDIGFKRAWPSIRDSNAATLITCAILYFFGNNFGATLIVGFAVNLAIGVALSLFTAVTVTRNLLNLLLFFGVAQHPAWYGLPRSALNLPRYQRPVSRVALTGGRSAAVIPTRAVEIEDAADDADDADDVEDEGGGDGAAAEAVSNVRNGRTPRTSRANAAGATGGGGEELVVWFHLTRYRYLFFAISGAIIVPGLLALIFWHLNLGIDFTNGTTVSLRFQQANASINPNAVANVFRSNHAEDVNVFLSSDFNKNTQPSQIVYIQFDRPIGPDFKGKLLDQLNDPKAKLPKATDLHTDSILPS